jgi:uncharacterized membrane protein YjfL (UPF0719 family)
VNTTLVFVGLAKVGFGVLVAVLGIFLSTRMFGRAIGIKNLDQELAKGNTAAGVLVASAVVSLGLLAQHAVVATFSAMDLSYRNQAFEPRMLVAFGVYGLAHVLTAFLVGLAVLVLGKVVFARLTRGVDEMEEIRKGNVAPALVLGGVVVVLALMTAPGLEMALTGLLPLPTLGRDELIAPS